MIDNTQNELFPKLRLRSSITRRHKYPPTTVLVNTLQSSLQQKHFHLHYFAWKFKMKSCLCFFKGYLKVFPKSKWLFYLNTFFWLLRNTYIEFTSEKLKIETVKYSNTTCFAFWGVVYVVFCDLNTESFFHQCNWFLLYKLNEEMAQGRN